MSARESIARSFKARELAGDARAGAWGRQRVWQDQRAFMVQRWRWLVGAWMLVASPALMACFFTTGFWQGLIVGGAVVGATAITWSFVVQSTGTGVRMMGNQAEQWTSQELRALRTHGWRPVNQLVLARDGDIDHVLVGPAGIVVLETKWSANSWLAPSVAERTALFRGQLQRKANRVRSWSRSWSGGMPVHAALVLWGGGLRRNTGGVMACPEEGVTVLAGHRLRGWLGELPADPSFDAETVDRVWLALATQVDRRDERDRSEAPGLHTPQQLLERLGVCVVAFTGAFFAVAEPSSHVGVGWGVAAGVGVTAIGCVGLKATKRRGLARAALHGVIAGSGVPTLAIAMALVADLVV